MHFTEQRQMNEFHENYRRYFDQFIKRLLNFQKFPLIKSRTCSSVKWDNREHLFFKSERDDELYSIPALSKPTFHKLTVIMGEMGTGKSTLCLQILKLYNSENPKATPVYFQLAFWKEVPEIEKLNNIDTIIDFLAFTAQQSLQRWLEMNSFLELENKQNHFLEKFALYLKNVPTLIVFDGIDEIHELQQKIRLIAKKLAGLNHRIIITGKNHVIHKLTPEFQQGRQFPFQLLELNSLTDREVEEFTKNVKIEEMISLKKIHNTMPIYNHKELNYKNPLILIIILENAAKQTTGLIWDTSSILETIAETVFASYIERKFIAYNFKFKSHKKMELNPENLKTSLFIIYQQLALNAVAKNRNVQAKEIKDEITNAIDKNKNPEEYKLIEEFLIKDPNARFIPVFSNCVQIIPKIISDLSIVSGIVVALTKNDDKQLYKVLNVIINNTADYKSTSQLLTIKLKSLQPELVKGFEKIEDKIIKENEELRILNKFGLSWRKNQILTKNGFIVYLDLNKTIKKIDSLLRNLGKFRKLTELNLSKCKLTSLPKNVIKLQNIVNLNLNYNQLTSLPQNISKLTKLKELSLYNNNLIFLSESLFELHNLQTLNLGDNGLSFFPESIYSLQKLRELNLSENRLSSLPENLCSLQELRELDLSGNELSSLPENLCSLQELRELDLSGNELSSLPESLSSLQELQILNLCYNKLSSLPEKFSSLQELQILNLRYNKLSSLPESLSSFQELRELYLRNNRLSSLPENITMLKNLQTLDLDSNQLSSLSTSMKNALKKLRKNGCKIVEW